MNNRLNNKSKNKQISYNFYIMLICENDIYYMMSICVMCLKTYDESEVNLQRKIVKDEDFCNECWTEVMNSE